MNCRRLLTLLLVLCIIATMAPIPAFAAELSASESLIQFIKDCEGFTQYATWDYQHYAIGYGCQCNREDYPNGITEEEADALLRECMSDSVASVNSFVKKNNMSPTQQEFDCMVSITFGLGIEWMRSGYDLPRLLINGCTELELLNALGGWVTAQGQTLNGLIYRRMRETYIYFHGKYNKTDSIADDVPYACVKFDPNGGTVAYKRVYTFRGKAYGMGLSLPVPTKSGYTFDGWYDDSGNRVTNDTIAKSVLMTVKARWTAQQSLYTDVHSGDWFYSNVKYATELGLFNGYRDGSFRPNDTMTRAMFAQVLYRIAGSPSVDAQIPFCDVAAGAWYETAVRWAYSEGVVKGVTDTEFAPNQIITREQMATMLYKYAVGFGSADSSMNSGLDGFKDVDEISKYAQIPMRWAVGTGLMNGMTKTTLAPKNVATRAQAATILIRLLGIVEKGIA